MFPYLFKSIDRIYLSSLKNNSSIRLIATSSAPRAQWQQAVKDLDPKQVEFYHNEQLIKVNEHDEVLGPMSKGESHSIETVRKNIYHRALSLLIFDDKDRFLLTQRAACKITFPSYYTNACCSHPLYNASELEEDGNAIGARRATIRRTNFELGVNIESIEPKELKLMNKIAYRAESDGGCWGEAEIDYIFVLRKKLALNPNPEEVQDFRYVTKSEMHDLLTDVSRQGVKITPWVRLLAKDFLFSYWNNLNKLETIENPGTIFHYRDIFPAN